MALQSVYEMVLNRLKFVPLTGWETNIEAFETEQMYYLNAFLQNKTDAEVEDEANWTGVERILLAELTTYQLLIKEIIKTVGGDAEVSSKPGAGNRLIKKGKADVVEAEFEYAKAEDGRTLAVKAAQLISELKNSICRYASALDLYLPGYCSGGDDADVPAFLVYEG